MTITALTITWGISRGRDTEGYNICRLRDTSTGWRTRCMGGGYDMQGTVFAAWLQDNYPGQLLTIADRASATYVRDDAGVIGRERNYNDDALYGMTLHKDSATPAVTLDGACGLSSVERVAEAIGLRVQHVTDRNGHLTSLLVTDTK